MDFFLKKSFLLKLLLCCIQTLVTQQLHATRTFLFASPSSKVVLGDYAQSSAQVQGYFKYAAGMSTLIGFDQQSVIKGNSQANTFSNAWTCSLGTGMVAAGSTVSTMKLTRDLTATTSDLSRFVSTTSNAVNVQSSTLRTISNWVNKQYGDFGGSNLGLQLRGTSNWVNRQVSDMGSAALGYNLRVSSHWINKQFVDFGASTLGRQLRGTSNWVSNNAMLVRSTSNWVNGSGSTMASAITELSDSSDTLQSLVGQFLRATSMRAILGLTTDEDVVDVLLAAVEVVGGRFPKEDTLRTS